jgi:hypothetical protein
MAMMALTAIVIKDDVGKKKYIHEKDIKGAL